MDDKEMRLLIENYKSNVDDLERAKDRLNKLKHNTKITAAYGLNTGGASGGFSSKVENNALEIIKLENEISELTNKIYIVDCAEKILTKKETEIIEYIKEGFENKVSVIAKLLGPKVKKKFVFDTRNRAIRKMCDYIGDKYEI